MIPLPQPAPRPGENALRLAGAAAAAIIAMHFMQSFAQVPDMAFPESGTPWAPHSDALGPWLDGGLAFLFGLPPPRHLYRPTIGLFWGSIVGATGRIEAIGVLFATWLLLVSAAFATLASDRPLRNSFVFLLAFAALRFPETWLRLNLNVDLAALAFTLSGVLLVLWRAGPRSTGALLVGCACLGVSAAIRGPLLFAAPVILGARLLAMERVPRATAVAAIAAFLLPIAIDNGIQRYLGTMNNGMQALYCVYADPTHVWTARCRVEYLKLDPAGPEIVASFLRFLLSPEGSASVLGHLRSRVGYDLGLLASPACLAILAALAALASGRHPGRASTTPFVRALLVLAALAITWLVAARLPSAPLLWCLGAAAAAAMLRQPRAFACLVAYLAGSLFLNLLGLPEDRLQYTFGFLLVLGIAFLVMEDEGAVASPGRAASFLARAIPATLGMLLLALYVGSFLFPSSLRDRYAREVHGKDAAIKIGDDARIDRSLYYSGGRRLIYTRHDALAIGDTRAYRALASDAQGNLSFKSPNAFID